jgi:hypothetical protein
MRGESNRRDYGPPARVYGKKDGASFQIIVLVSGPFQRKLEIRQRELGLFIPSFRGSVGADPGSVFFVRRVVACSWELISD